MASKKKADEFKDIRVGDQLAARVYRNGKVILAVRSAPSSVTNPVSMDVEVTSNWDQARKFCEAVTGMINTMSGRY